MTLMRIGRMGQCSFKKTLFLCPLVSTIISSIYIVKFLTIKKKRVLYE
jgi:hypothetical protein